MQLIVGAGDMQKFDRAAIGKYSIAGLVLMENAGRAFVEELERHRAPLRGRSVVIVCGGGNNGGDGFVIARHLVNRGALVTVVSLASPREIKGDARANIAILQHMVKAGCEGLAIREIRSSKVFSKLGQPDIIVDAIFGTGFSGETSGIHRGAIEWINGSAAYVAAVDIPSGVNASSGMVDGVAVQADLTVTMGLGKIGQYVGAGRDHAGAVVVADISIPEFIMKPGPGSTFRVHSNDVAGILPRRPVSAHKYSVGKVFVLGGSRGLTGAPFMCSQSAMKAGAGAVILGVPSSVHSILARKVTEVMVAPLPETEDGTISLAAIGGISTHLKWADVIAIGPGLSFHDETRKLVIQLLASVAKPIVLDADGLNSVSDDLSAIKKRKAPTIITPHAGELGRMIKTDVKVIERERVETARSSSKDLNCVVVLKGAPTATATPDGSVFLNSSGNPGMATAGAGDVLTGTIAGLMAQGMKPDEAAYGGAFIHGLAGDYAAKAFGERSLLAADILDHLPHVFKSLEVR